MYLLNGDSKELDRVVKENRIRVNRGIISLVPLSESGLITGEEAQKLCEDKDALITSLTNECNALTSSVTEKNALITSLTCERDELSASVSDKDALIASLTSERDELLKRVPVTTVVMTEQTTIEDTKDITQDNDSKSVDMIENKETLIEDDKTVVTEGKKRTGRPKKAE